MWAQLYTFVKKKKQSRSVILLNTKCDSSQMHIIAFTSRITTWNAPKIHAHVLKFNNQSLCCPNVLRCLVLWNENHAGYYLIRSRIYIISPAIVCSFKILYTRKICTAQCLASYPSPASIQHSFLNRYPFFVLFKVIFLNIKRFFSSLNSSSVFNTVCRGWHYLINKIKFTIIRSLRSVINRMTVLLSNNLHLGFIPCPLNYIEALVTIGRVLMQTQCSECNSNTMQQLQQLQCSVV